jgi:hypothetical protein
MMRLVPDQRRYHVYRTANRQQRTTVTLDIIVSDLLSMKLGHTPGTETAHAAVRDWLQAEIDRDRTVSRLHLSQWLRERAIRAIADPALLAALEGRERKE